MFSIKTRLGAQFFWFHGRHWKMGVVYDGTEDLWTIRGELMAGPDLPAGLRPTLNIQAVTGPTLELAAMSAAHACGVIERAYELEHAGWNF